MAGDKALLLPYELRTGGDGPEVRIEFTPGAAADDYRAGTTMLAALRVRWLTGDGDPAGPERLEDFITRLTENFMAKHDNFKLLSGHKPVPSKPAATVGLYNGGDLVAECRMPTIGLKMDQDENIYPDIINNHYLDAEIVEYLVGKAAEYERERN